MFTWLKRLTGKDGAPENTASLRQVALARRYLALARSGALRARYDAAVTTENNRRHWANADALSADAAGSGRRRPAPLRARERMVSRGLPPCQWAGAAPVGSAPDAGQAARTRGEALWSGLEFRQLRLVRPPAHARVVAWGAYASGATRGGRPARGLWGRAPQLRKMRWTTSSRNSGDSVAK